MIDIAKTEQGNIKTLFPNLGMQVVANGCICEIICVSNQQIKVIVIEAYNSAYKIGSYFWIDTFLIQGQV